MRKSFLWKMASILGLVLIASPSSGQVYYAEYPLYQGTIFTTQTDSAYLHIATAFGNTATFVYGQQPDSIRLAWYGYGGSTGDSIGLRFQYRLEYSNVNKKYVMTTLDSIKAQTIGSHVIPNGAVASQISFYVLPSLGVQNTGTGNPNPSKLWLKVQYFYRVGR